MRNELVLEIPDKLYKQLERSKHYHNLDSVQDLLEEWRKRAWEEELRRRRAVVDRVLAFQKYMLDKYGVMEDSVELIREDRDR